MAGLTAVRDLLVDNASILCSQDPTLIKPLFYLSWPNLIVLLLAFITVYTAPKIMFINSMRNRKSVFLSFLTSVVIQYTYMFIMSIIGNIFLCPVY